MNVQERRLKMLELIYRGVFRVKDLVMELGTSYAVTSQDKSSLKNQGLVETVGFKGTEQTQLTRLGLKKLGLEIFGYSSLVPINDIPRSELLTRAEKTHDYRMSVLGYLTFEKQMPCAEVAKLLGVAENTIRNYFLYLLTGGYITGSHVVTKKGLAKLDSYDCDLY